MTLEVQLNETVRHLKVKLNAKIQIDPGLQHIFCDGVECRNDTLLSELNFEEVELRVRIRLYIHGKDGKFYGEVESSPQENVLALKRVIEESFRYPVENQVLLHRGTVLNDTDGIENSGVCNQDAVILQTDGEDEAIASTSSGKLGDTSAVSEKLNVESSSDSEEERWLTAYFESRFNLKNNKTFLTDNNHPNRHHRNRKKCTDRRRNRRQE